MVFAFSSETIAAGHIAGVGHMKAQSLDDRLALLEQIGLPGKHIFCKQFLFLAQGFQIFHDFRHIFSGNSVAGCNDPDYFFLRDFFIKLDNIVGNIVHRMYAAAFRV